MSLLPPPPLPGLPPTPLRERVIGAFLIAGVFLAIATMLALAWHTHRQKRSEWRAYAADHGCIHVPARRRAPNVAVQAAPINSNPAAAPVVDLLDPHLHAWRCADGRFILNGFEP